jgi:hypothetical protein
MSVSPSSRGISGNSFSPALCGLQIKHNSSCGRKPPQPRNQFAVDRRDPDVPADFAFAARHSLWPAALSHAVHFDRSRSN